MEIKNIAENSIKDRMFLVPNGVFGWLMVIIINSAVIFYFGVGVFCAVVLCYVLFSLFLNRNKLVIFLEKIREPIEGLSFINYLLSVSVSFLLELFIIYQIYSHVEYECLGFLPFGHGKTNGMCVLYLFNPYFGMLAILSIGFLYLPIYVIILLTRKIINKPEINPVENVQTPASAPVVSEQVTVVEPAPQEPVPAQQA